MEVVATTKLCYIKKVTNESYFILKYLFYNTLNLIFKISHTTNYHGILTHKTYNNIASLRSLFY